MSFDWAAYRGREQTGVKHFILAEYLASFAPIIGTFRDTITYVDCFSGPWRAESEKYEDTSFAIALRELKKAQGHKQNNGEQLAVRAFFVESNKDAFAELESFCAGRPDDGIEVVRRRGELEDQIADIVRFVNAGGRKNFPFIFVDPTGWAGFSLMAITPLLKLRPCEVLINFMTSHITRWVEHPDEKQRKVFEDLYGAERCARVIARVRDRSDIEREEILVSEYMDAIRNVGDFEHMSAAVVLNPNADRTHFHLIYASRNSRGVDVFKTAERRAMESMLDQRSTIKDRKAEARDAQQGQFTMEFGAGVPRIDDFYDKLRGRYLVVARERTLQTLQQASGGVQWDRLHARALEVPLTFPSDLKEWVRQWQASGSVEVTGLKGKERVPKSGSKVIWRQPVDLSPFTISEFLTDGRQARLAPPLTISPELEDETGSRLVANSLPFPFTLRGSSRDALREDFITQLSTAIRQDVEKDGPGLGGGERTLRAMLRERVQQ